MEIRLPTLSETSDTGTIVRILVSEGDRITQGTPLFEIEIEKAVVPVPSPITGTVMTILVKEGDEVRTGQVLMTIAPVTEEGQHDAPMRPEKETQPMETAPTKETSPPSHLALGPPASPSIRRMAADLGLDLSRIRGSGRGGRIVLDDLRAYIRGLEEAAAQGRETAPQETAPSQTALPRPAPSESGPVRREKLSPLRKTVARRMIESWRTIPHVSQFDEADITSLLDLRACHKDAYEHRGARLTLTVFILSATVGALKKYPLFNASLDEAAGEIVFNDHYHLAVAVDTEAGLMAPVIRDAGGKNLLELSLELAGLADKARQRKVSLEDLQGATFTVSNLGGIGGTHFAPIILKPQVAVLGVGRTVPRVLALGERLDRRMVLPLGVSYDHRLIDGADGARFIKEIVRQLEEFPEAAVLTGMGGP